MMLGLVFFSLVLFGLKSSPVHDTVKNPTDKGGVTHNLNRLHGSELAGVIDLAKKD
jgi:hypothetical protein